MENWYFLMHFSLVFRVRQQVVAVCSILGQGQLAWPPWPRIIISLRPRHAPPSACPPPSHCRVLFTFNWLVFAISFGFFFYFLFVCLFNCQQSANRLALFRTTANLGRLANVKAAPATATATKTTNAAAIEQQQQQHI